MSMNRTKTFILLSLLTALMLFVGNLLGGTGGLIIAFFFVIVFNGISYFWSHKIVLAMYKAQEINKSQAPELFEIVKEVAHKANIPMPKVYIIPSMQANAFATGRNPKNGVVAVTKGIMELLTKDELKGVIAHEMSHIKNRDILIQTIASMIAGVISYLATMAKWGAIFGGFNNRDGDSNIIEILAIAIITPIVAFLIQMAISRSREYMADESAAKIIGSGRGLATALQKIESSTKHVKMNMGSPSTSSMFISNPFKDTGIMSLLSTHPKTSERIKRLESF